MTIPFLGVRGPPTTRHVGLAASCGRHPTARRQRCRPRTDRQSGLRELRVVLARAVRARGDSALKPDHHGAGVSIFSTASGTGNGGEILSGTSMASPHVAGSRRSRARRIRRGASQDIKAAIVNTGLPSGVVGYRTSRGGTGLVQPGEVDAVAGGRAGEWRQVHGVGQLRVRGAERATSASTQGDQAAATTARPRRPSTSRRPMPAGRPHTVSFDKTVGHAFRLTADAEVDDDAARFRSRRQAMPTVRDCRSAKWRAWCSSRRPAATDNAGVTLRVPYYLVPRAQSDISTTHRQAQRHQSVDDRRP